MEYSTQISVIVPAHNAEKYAAQCLENLLYQTYKNLEIIVVDDDSTDNTAQIIQKYPVKYIHQKNSGVAVARNAGIDAATGEYIHFMDVDDLINLEFYEKMIQAAVDTQSDMACCSFVFERFPNQTQKIEHRFLVSIIEDKLLATNVCNYGACWKYLFKRSFLKEKNLYFEAGRLAQDRIFSIQAVFYANKIVSAPEAVYFYKNRTDSITLKRKVSFIKKRHQDRQHAVQFQIDFARQNHFSLDKTLNQQHWQYKLLGLPVVTKRIYHAGKIRWYFFNIPVFQKKEIDL
ncbi:MAG: glycosyltransferase [Candidatus Azobacteroides sp.]|nr:glycosyltransferase [Candidatus Azobacteroides sp.]